MVMFLARSTESRRVANSTADEVQLTTVTVAAGQVLGGARVRRDRGGHQRAVDPPGRPGAGGGGGCGGGGGGGGRWLEFLEGPPRDKTTWRILVRARTPKRAIPGSVRGLW